MTEQTDMTEGMEEAAAQDWIPAGTFHGLQGTIPCAQEGQALQVRVRAVRRGRLPSDWANSRGAQLGPSAVPPDLRDFPAGGFGNIAVYGDRVFFTTLGASEPVGVYRFDRRSGLPVDGTFGSTRRGFSLDRANRLVRGISLSAERFFVVDEDDDKVYVYAHDGTRHATEDFDLADENADPVDIAVTKTRLLVLDATGDKVYVYAHDGTRHATEDFDLADENADPEGLAASSDRLFVGDRQDGKVYVYAHDGTRHQTEDFDYPLARNRFGNSLATFATLAYWKGFVFYMLPWPIRFQGRLRVWVFPFSDPVGDWRGVGTFRATQGSIPCADATRVHVRVRTIRRGKDPSDWTQLSPRAPLAFAAATFALEAPHGDPFSLTLPAATGGRGDIVYRIQGRPPGFVLDQATRKLTGIWVVGRAYTFVLMATDYFGSGSTVSAQVTVTAVMLDLSFGQASYTYEATVGSPFSQALPAASGGNPPRTYAAVGTLPQGWSFDASSRILAGTLAAEKRKVRNMSEEFDLYADDNFHSSNTQPSGIAVTATRIWVVDTGGTNRIFVYAHDGTRQSDEEFIFFLLGTVLLIAVTATRIYGYDAVEKHIVVYAHDGTRQPDEEFDLHADNDNTTGIAATATRIWAVNIGETSRIFVYAHDGTRQQSEEFDLHADNARPGGIAITSTRVWVTDFADDRIYVYAHDGTRQQSEEFDLDADNATPRGLAVLASRIWVLDTMDDHVYVYNDLVGFRFRLRATDADGDTADAAITVAAT